MLVDDAGSKGCCTTRAPSQIEMLECELATSGGGVEFWERSSMTASAGPIAVGKPPRVAEGTDITEWEMLISIELIDRKGCPVLAGEYLIGLSVLPLWAAVNLRSCRRCRATV